MLLLSLQGDMQPIQDQLTISRPLHIAKMMSIGRTFRMPSVAGSVIKKFMSTVEIVNNKNVLAKLRSLPGKKIIYFVSNKRLTCSNTYNVIYRH